MSGWPGDSGCLTVTSSNPSLILIDAGNQGNIASLTTPVTAGTATISVGIEAVGTAPAGTTVTITASFPGYANGTATITYANSGFVVYGPNGIGGAFQTFQGVQTSLTVYAARLDSSGLFVEPENVAKGSTISVPIASSTTSVGTVSPTLLSFTGGTNSATATFTASGTNTGSTSVMLTQPAGFTTPTVGGTLNATVQTERSYRSQRLSRGQEPASKRKRLTQRERAASHSCHGASLDSTRLQFACPPAGIGTPQCTPSSGASSPSITVIDPSELVTIGEFLRAGV